MNNRSTVLARRVRVLGLGLTLLLAITLGGCNTKDALDIRLLSVEPDPLVIDLNVGNDSTVTLKLDYALIGSSADSDCHLVAFNSPLAGIKISTSFDNFSTICSEGEQSQSIEVSIDRVALRAEPSGSYTARIEIDRCIYPDLDPTPGARDCVRTGRDFTIELRGAAAPAPPPAPQDFAATVVDGTYIELTWLDNPRAQGYVLERQTDGGDFALLATQAAGTDSFSDGSAAFNTPYTYRLTATNATGSSPPVTASARITQMRNLSLALEARGSDSVSSAPAGIACPTDCSQTYAFNEVVLLTPTPSTVISGGLSRFLGWSGDPDCSDGSVTMDADKTCTARFSSGFEAKVLTIGRAGSGSGRVTSNPAGIDCPGTCSAYFLLGTAPSLTATADPGSVFVSWTGGTGCGSGFPIMNADTTCTANFADVAGAEQTLTVYVQGTGSVTSVPAGIACSDANGCPARFARGQVVALTATPGTGQLFIGWAGSADCADGQVTMSADLSCVANFASASAQWVTGAAALNQTSQFAASSILEPAIRVDAAGRPVVAWTENSKVYLYRPFGAGVTQVSVNPSNDAPSVLMEPSDGPLVALTEETATDQRNVRLRRFPSNHAPGSLWTDVGSGPLDTKLSTDAREPSVVLRNGRITVAWVEGDPGAGSRVVVRSLDGTGWSGVGNGSGPAPSTSDSQSSRPRLVVTGSPGSQGLALMWGEDTVTLRVAELVGDEWVSTATAPYASLVQTDRADMMWTADLGLVVVAAESDGSLAVRRWSGGAWANVGTTLGDASPGSFVLALAFSHGPSDATPLLAYAINRGNGGLQETVVHRFIGGSWLRLGDALPAIDRHSKSAQPRAVAVADHAQPEVAVVLKGVLPGTATSDNTLAVYRFE